MVIGCRLFVDLSIFRVDQADREIHEYGLSLVIDRENKVLCCRNHDLLTLVVNKEQDVDRLVIDAGDFADGTQLLVDDLVSDEAEVFFGLGIIVLLLLLGEASAIKVEREATEWLGFLLRVNVLERKENAGGGAEPIAGEEKRYEDAIELHHQIGTPFDIIEYRVGDGGLQFAFQAMQLGDVAYLNEL